MTSDIKLTYIDDKLDPLLVDYLYTISEKEHIFEYDEYNFDSSKDSYQSLLENTNIASSDIIIVDSKLFENEFADSKSKFTGQELKIIYAIANPFIKIIVITQNNNLSKYGVIKKFATSRECSGREQEEANKYYDHVLRKEIETLIKNVKENLEEVNIEKAQKEFKNFVKLHNEEIERIKKGNVKTLKCMGF